MAAGQLCLCRKLSRSAEMAQLPHEHVANVSSAQHTQTAETTRSQKKKKSEVGERGGVDRTAIEQDDGEWMRLGDWPSDLLHFKFGDIFCMSFIFIAYAKN